MSLEALKQEAAALDEPSRKELFAYMVSLREQQWAALIRTLARNLDDSDARRWLTLKEFETRLNRIPEPPQG